MAENHGTPVRSSLSLAALLLLTSCGTTPKKPSHQPRFTESVRATSFYKGNLHAHTKRTDGDASPENVVRWYKERGYSFLAVTDRNQLTLERRYDDDTFITLNGVELAGHSASKKPVHASAICGKSPLKGTRANRPTAELMNEQVAASRKDGAVTIFNHPNLGWAFTPEELLATEGFELLEIASGNPEANERGDGKHPSHEELWDIYMTRKHRIFGVAVDGARHFHALSEKKANPGRAWVAAWAPELSQTAICEALRFGHFYSSTGTKLDALVVTPSVLEVAVANWDPTTDHIDFIGASGQLLDRTRANPARYHLRGGEGYVRAHVHQGKREAWTQAYFIKYE